LSISSHKKAFALKIPRNFKKGDPLMNIPQVISTKDASLGSMGQEYLATLDGQSVQCKAGDSWLVPKGAPHRYRIIDSIVAIEATSPPARLNNRDEAIKT